MRLITRSDFDGLVCATLLKELNVIDEIFYTHPKDIQDGKIAVTDNDILANVPFISGCGLWFDHHSSEEERLHLDGKYKGLSMREDSAARVINNYYLKNGNDSQKESLKKFDELLVAVDKADSARYTVQDIINPSGWMLLAFISDPRSGFGYKKDFGVSNFELMKKMPDYFRSKSIDEILELPDVRERAISYKEQNGLYFSFIKEHSVIKGEAILIDLRGLKEIPVGNRFIEYTIFPEQNISVRIIDGRNDTCAISIGKSIINRSSNIDVGSICLKYGGGGHKAVGTCQVDYKKVDETIVEILEAINS